MKPAADEHEAEQQPPVRMRTRRLNGTTQAIPEPRAFQPALALDGYPTPDPDDTRAHLKMAYELAREVIQQARIAEQAEERLRELDLERYRVRERQRGWGTHEEREKRMLRDVGGDPRDEAEIERERSEAIEAEAAASGKAGAAAETLRRYHGEILPMCAAIGEALAVTGDGLGTGHHAA